VFHVSVLRKYLEDPEQKIEAKPVSTERLRYGVFPNGYLRVISACDVE
jgi:hypothetical protein